MIQNLIRDKSVLLAFSDPAGALQVLSFAEKYLSLFKSIIAVSDRSHSFYGEFSTNVKFFANNDPHEWLVSNHIDLVITGTSLPLSLEMAFIEASTEISVSSVSLIDHWINMAARFKKNDDLVLPTWIGVIDDRAKQIAIEEGLPAAKLIITGNAYYELLASWKPTISRESFLNSMNIPENAVYVLYAPEPLSKFNLQETYGFTEIDGMKKIYQVMNSILCDNIFIIIKGHANQQHDVFLDYIKSVSIKNIKYTHQLDIKLCTYFSEFVLGFFSNSLIEANIMKKIVMRPLMMLNPNVNDPFETMTSETFKVFHDDEVFTKEIESFFNHSLCTSLPAI